MYSVTSFSGGEAHHTALIERFADWGRRAIPLVELQTVFEEMFDITGTSEITPSSRDLDVMIRQLSKKSRLRVSSGRAHTARRLIGKPKRRTASLPVNS